MVKPVPRFSSLAGWVFWPALLVIGVFVGWAAFAGQGAAAGIEAFRESVVDGLSWYYVPLVTLFVVFVLYVGFSRFGSIRLGKDHQKPDFGVVSWLAMLFAAGMGIGLVFWGVAEPLSFFHEPKPGVAEDAAERSEFAMSHAFLHWGLHPWAIYIVVGLAIAYAVHRKGRPVSIRWALEPILGDRVKGWLGNVIDVIALVGTVFGVATSLGLGVQQIGAGLDYLGWIDGRPSDGLLTVLIIGITLLATYSVISGLPRGIKWLSNTNMAMAVALLAFVLVAGPTTVLLTDLFEYVGRYLRDLPSMAFDTGSMHGDEGTGWVGGWTVFYWGWWMSWAPFVGIFIARISRGRTVREFVFGVLLVPTVLSFVWFTLLGGSALREQREHGGLTEAAAAGGGDGREGVDETGALYQLLDTLPGGGLVIGLTILLIVLFFVTSSDSGSYVVDMLASGGDPDPPTWSRVFWSAVEGAVAISLLVAGSGAGLETLKNVAVTIALPFSVVMVLMCFATLKEFRAERAAYRAAEQRRHEARLIGSAVAALEQARGEGDGEGHGDGDRDGHGDGDRDGHGGGDRDGGGAGRG